MCINSVVSDISNRFIKQMELGGPISYSRSLNKKYNLEFNYCMEVFNSYTGILDFFLMDTIEGRIIKHFYIYHNTNKDDEYLLKEKLIKTVTIFTEHIEKEGDKNGSKDLFRIFKESE